MNIKRALGFGVMLWIVISILMFAPFLEGKEMAQNIIYWVLLVPIVLLLSKWYFKADPPTLKKGFLLGVIALVVGTILDLIITIPLFVKDYAAFYGDWKLWFGFAEVLLLTIFAGFEFDKTFTKPKSQLGN